MLRSDKTLIILADDILLAFLRLERKLRDGARPEHLLLPGDTVGTSVLYDTDENGDDYAFVIYSLGKFTFAEIEDHTYGQLKGLRIYLGTQDGAGIPDHCPRR